VDSQTTPQPARTYVRLHPQTLERLAARTAALVAEHLARAQSRTDRPELLTAAEVSAWWGVKRGWIYQHAEELGAIRIGTGERPRLRFDEAQVAQRLARPAQREATPETSAASNRIASNPQVAPGSKQS
jgi:hypothetical protein